MSDQVVTEFVINADTSGAAAYERAMDGAARAASRGIGAIGDFEASLAAVGAGALAAIVGLNSLVDHVVKANKQLADMQRTAKEVGLSLADFQGVQFGGQIAGLSEAQVTAGLQKSAQLLNDAQRNANSLSKEFEANGISIRNANGQLISQNQLLGIAADLIKRARSSGDQAAIAEMLGFTKEWIPFLEQGAGAMVSLTDEARKAGAIIDDETINKAAEFDREWRKSSVQMEFYLKSALLSLLPYADDLIMRLSNFISSIDVAKAAAAAQAHADEQLQRLRDAGVPESGGIKIEITPGTEQALEDFRNATPFTLDFWRAAGRVFSSSIQVLGERDVPFAGAPSAGSFRDRFPASMHTGEPSVPPVMDTSDAAMGAAKAAAAWSAQGESWKKFSADVLAGADQISGGFSKVAARSKEVDDAFDRAIATAKQHIDQLYADADAVGLGAGALAKYRTEAKLMSAAEAQGRPITEQLKAQIAALGDEAADAATDLERVRVAAQIDFARKTAFLSPEDVQIAQQLQKIYGNDVPTALASSEAAAIRVNNAIREGRDVGLDFAKTFVQGLLQAKSPMEALTVAAEQLASKMGDKALTDLFSGNFAQAGVEGIIAIGASLFAGDQKAKKEMEEAKKQWAQMADQVNKFNLAAKGVDLGPLTNELNSLYSSFKTLFDAAVKAKDYGGAGSLTDTFNASVNRVLTEFAHGADVLSPLQQQIKGVNDEAAGLKDTLGLINAGGDFRGFIDSAAQAQIKALVAQFTDTVTQGLQERLNAAQGKGYLNDAAGLLKQHQTDLANAAELRNDPAMLAQIAAVFAAEAQKIIQDAGLVGDQFADFIDIFPDLAGVVHQATVDVTDSIKTIQQYLESLQVGSNSILSPEDQLAAAQANFNRQLALAQSGDADALGSITQYAQTLLDQAKGFYASSDGYAAIYQAVTAALGALAGPAAFAPSAAVPTASVAPSAASPVANALASTRSSAANDNGQYFAQLGQTFTQAQAAATQAQVQALRDAVEVLGGKLDRVANATEGAGRRGGRPSQKGAA
ncbi:hypothetical protein OZ411_01330 [Bradyrhizobium sp. Arg237L]|uniref:hypothetical protein n=1 Tax=Bradyrhizobium sp. Arg237L TaxID=3003352 RepID=UPI00249F66C1|nr:hypothetical protein [Bradyrhizobium sp. Arg237L]MDI4231455.1 hypothetical protein [Bradyrhizobium sp. Arg237L]